jgi:hypothetical protein
MGRKKIYEDGKGINFIMSKENQESLDRYKKALHPSSEINMSFLCNDALEFYLSELLSVYVKTH